MEGHLVILLLVVCGTLGLDGPPRTVDEYIEAARENAKAAGYKEDVGDAVLVEGDILMSKEEYENTKKGIDTHKGLRDENYRWTGNTIPYTITNEFSSSQVAAIKRGMAEWEKYTCIRFTPRSSQSNYIRIHSGGGCSSWVGMIGGRQDVSLAKYGCVYHATIVHELGHAVGFHHEQTRPDRDNYIYLYLSNVSPNMRYNFDKYSTQKINTQGVPYDYRSVMHYGRKSFSTNRRDTIVPKDQNYLNVIGHAPGLSFRDIKAANLMYKCGSDCSITCPEGAIVNQDCKCWCSTNNPRDPVYECEGSEGSGGQGSGDPGTCEDTGDNCQSRASAGECDSNPDVMLYDCPVSCEVCPDDTSCKNYRPDCERWALQGYCLDPDYLAFMSKFCRGACRFCEDGTIDPDCGNNNDRCQEWANRGECDINPNYMLWNCKKACRLCGENAECKNYDSSCNQWANDGYCTDAEYKDFMSRFCRLSCGC